MLELWKARPTRPTKVVPRERTINYKNTTDAHNLESTKPVNNEPEVEVGVFDMCYFNVDAVEVPDSEMIETGVPRAPHTGSGFLVM